MTLVGTRLRYMDMAKAVAIFLVVYGHCTEGITIVTSFNMPLFMMISGFFVISTLDLSAKDFIKKISKYYIIPFLCFSLLGQIILLFQDPPSGPLGFMVRWMQFAWLWDIWFLRDLVFFMILTYISYHIANKHLLWTIVVCFLIINLIPTDIGITEADKVFTPVRKSTVFNLPFFLFGLFMRKVPDVIDNLNLYLMIVVSLVMLYFFKFEESWYCTPHHTLVDFVIPNRGGQIADWTGYSLMETYRYVIGLVVSITVILFVQRMAKIESLNKINNYIGEYGKYTLGIYLIHPFFNNYCPEEWKGSTIMMRYILYPMIIVLISWLLSYMLTKSKFRWMLGK